MMSKPTLESGSVFPRFCDGRQIGLLNIGEKKSSAFGHCEVTRVSLGIRIALRARPVSCAARRLVGV